MKKIMDAEKSSAGSVERVDFKNKYFTLKLLINRTRINILQTFDSRFTGPDNWRFRRDDIFVSIPLLGCL